MRFAESSQGVSSAELAALTAQVSGAQARVAALQKEREDWVSRNTEHHLEQRLRGLIEETERESEDLLGAWNDGVMEYAEFMAKYLGVRTKLAERKLKLDTFQEKLLQARLAAGASPSRG